ncbi:MAG TPA: MipA/OmpV family protein [Gammaproteobacteria bacterium]|nr:MipA/OmpV family protein [Gammaproteobacteria bacterium]
MISIRLAQNIRWRFVCTFFLWIMFGITATLAGMLPVIAFAADSTANNNAQNSTNPEDQIISEASQNKGSSWSLGLGVAISEPGYIGVSNQITPLPLIFYHHGRFFFAGISVGYVPFNGRHYTFAILAKPRINRLSASESSQLAGIQSRKWSIDGGGRLSLFGDWGRVDAGVFTDLLHRYNGIEADLDYRYPIRMTGWTLSPGIGLAWYNSPLTNYYYGVSQAEVAPGRPAYAPGRATNPFVQLNLQVPLGNRWQFLGGVKYLHFARSIQNSPIVDRSDTLTVFLAMSYRFESR